MSLEGLICPNCRFRCPPAGPECPKCGLVFAKWKAMAGRPLGAALPAQGRSSATSGMILLAALVVCAAGVWLKLGGEAPQARRSPPEARARGGQWPPDIDQGAFQEFALAPGGRSLIMFYSHDCGVCRLAMPAFQRLHQASNGLYRVGLVDIRRSPNLALRWSIRGVPTFMAFQDGAEVATVTGAPGEDPEAIFLGLSEFARRSFR